MIQIFIYNKSDLIKFINYNLNIDYIIDYNNINNIYNILFENNNNNNKLINIINYNKFDFEIN